MASGQPFCQMIRASGLAEPWIHSHDDAKFDQFGWRCTTKESGYGNDTLVGNYTEERFDLRERLKSKPLPSQYNHYFMTTYNNDFNKGEPSLPSDVKGLKRLHPRTFPGHQPELDTAAAKAVYNDWNTTSTSSYKPFNIVEGNQRQICDNSCQQEPQWKVTMETTPITHLGTRSGPPATGGHVIAAPHSAPGSGLGAHQRSYRRTVGC